MIKNYLKIAWRNLNRNKAFSLINISGLAIGMACSLLILLWIQHEVSYDRFHEKKDRIYEAWNRTSRNNIIECWNTTPKVLAKTLQTDFPEVELTARVNWQSNFLMSVGDRKITAKGNMVDSGFLQIFSFPLVKGDLSTALNGVFSIVLTEGLAKRLFGNEEAMGKVIKLDNQDNFIVTGIVRDPPPNSRFTFEYLLSWGYMRYLGNDDEYWGNNSTRTYVLLKPNTKMSAINTKLVHLRKEYDSSDPEGGFFLYPVERWHLYSNFENGVETGGLIELIRLFVIIAVFILLIACINFMNLSTARSEKRSREVGIRKVAGAQRFSIVMQFLGESLFLALLSGVLALILVQASLPAFNALTGSNHSIQYNDPAFWLLIVGFIVVTGILAGSYPAFFLSSFKPVKVLKGTFTKAKTLITPRKILVISQFTFAIILIICTIIIHRQIQHARERETGYNKNNLVYHYLTGDLNKNFALIKNELLSAGIAESVTRTSSPLTESWSNGWGFEWQGKDPNDRTLINRFAADAGIVKTGGMQLVMGRDLDLQQFPTDSSAVIINEAAARLMNFDQPLGQIVKDGNNEYHVTGVVKDFILQSPFHPIEPMVICGPKWLSFNVIHIRFSNAGSIRENIAATGRIFKKYNPEYPFDYKFIDEEYARKFVSGNRFATLASLFAVLTIFISCLGLFGLATYMAEARVKEIGVRKVLGASVTTIVTLLSKDFLKLVIISLVIASPIAWYAMRTWLADFPYRIAIGWVTFAVAGTVAILIALLTVSYQAVKAALQNPVKSLRTE